MLRLDAGSSKILLEEGYALFAQGRRLPSSLVFGEDGKGFGPDLGSAMGSLFDTSGNADMGAYVFFHAA